MLVILLMALLVSAAALSFTKPLRLAREQDAMELVRSFDEASRQAARRFGRDIRMEFDLANSGVRRREGERPTYQAALPHGCRIRQVRTAARRASEGEIEISCSSLGVTRTYAVRLAGTGFDQWLLVSGFSGEITPIKDEAQLDAIFAATATRRDAQSAAQDTVQDSGGDDAD